MACYHPMTAYRSRSGRDPKTGKWSIVFDVKKGYFDMEVTVPCGQCIGCRLERSRQWAIRCIHEASLYDDNCFITLTYNDANLPQDGSLNKRDIQLFLKRLRKRFGEGIRFFQCGEYGSLLQRPHHHAILFNFDFPDKKLWTTRDGVRLYRSSILEELWPYGFATIGTVTFESAAYVARYITKKITGDLAAEYYGNRQPEFITMSRRPGIARKWFEKFSSDVFPSDSCVVRIGLVARPPKYYDYLYDLQDHDNFCRIKEKRVRLAKLSPNNTASRLEVREKIQIAKAKKLIRPIEM